MMGTKGILLGRSIHPQLGRMNHLRHPSKYRIGLAQQPPGMHENERTEVANGLLGSDVHSGGRYLDGLRHVLPGKTRREDKNMQLRAF